MLVLGIQGREGKRKRERKIINIVIGNKVQRDNLIANFAIKSNKAIVFESIATNQYFGVIVRKTNHWVEY